LQLLLPRRRESTSSNGLVCSILHSSYIDFQSHILMADLIFRSIGVNEAGAEFGTAIPGLLGKDYTWPVTQVLS